jgi:hypothetical protein
MTLSQGVPGTVAQTAIPILLDGNKPSDADLWALLLEYGAGICAGNVLSAIFA